MAQAESITFEDFRPRISNEADRNGMDLYSRSSKGGLHDERGYDKIRKGLHCQR